MSDLFRRNGNKLQNAVVLVQYRNAERFEFMQNAFIPTLAIHQSRKPFDKNHFHRHNDHDGGRVDLDLARL